mmetsp:Transcript_1357/g.2288  ORF Transcript_1357/g.2288 Transcript_1357/m.2288 type:complete len:394 (-) Transcript_1357:205-1386(-)|eukprot:CAMPEP_0197538236 /NCGR_PEP_ID=MMETSP1318-20131121/59253_1 /TAXON_ID=552666 /ORGANISM="Partenskyella glossopodia, Strain RCC365" /LENGTH=393 /DNA_ID=CAMNT_0043096605 /DNA_START=58 /DNA_END=1239 /DNA_ORIENTATION=-
MSFGLYRVDHSRDHSKSSLFAYEKPKKEPHKRWKVNAEKALKTGTRAAVYWPKKVENKERSILETKSYKQRDYMMVGSTYKGEWQLNQKHGFGVQVWAKGNKYEGQWRNGLQHGKGTFWVMVKKKLHKQYSGSWRKGLKSGLGVFFYKNGDRYEGEWLNGVRQGKGTLFKTDGEQYNGMWRDDKPCGFGRLVKASGDVYRGHWLNGKREGSGIYLYKAKQKIYDGEWVDDMPKCGVYCDAKQFLKRKANVDVSKQIEEKYRPIPILRLKDPDSLLISRIESIERERFAVRNLPYVELENQFSGEELDEMRQIFSRVDINGNGSVEANELRVMFETLDIPANPNDIVNIMKDLDKSEDSKISFDEFVRGVHFMQHTLVLERDRAHSTPTDDADF